MIEIHINCPHCQQSILIMLNEINCAIFRHGVYKANFQQINPHENKEICDDLFNKKLIYGCGKPFRLDKQDGKYVVSDCGYI